MGKFVAWAMAALMLSGCGHHQTRYYGSGQYVNGYYRSSGAYVSPYYRGGLRLGRR